MFSWKIKCAGLGKRWIPALKRDHFLGIYGPNFCGEKGATIIKRFETLPQGLHWGIWGWLHEIAGSLKFVLALLEGGAPTIAIGRVIAPINGIVKDGVRTLPTTGRGPPLYVFCLGWTLCGQGDAKKCCGFRQLPHPFTKVLDFCLPLTTGI